MNMKTFALAMSPKLRHAKLPVPADVKTAADLLEWNRTMDLAGRPKATLADMTSSARAEATAAFRALYPKGIKGGI